MAFVLFGALLLFPLIGPAREAFAEWWQSGHGGTAFIHRRFSLNQSLRDLTAGLSVLGFVAVATVAATSVTGERERRTWTGLTTTLLTGREVARAKVAGSVRAVRGPAIVFLVLWGLGLATGSVHPLGVLAAALGLFVFARFAAAVGVLMSMLSRRLGTSAGRDDPRAGGRPRPGTAVLAHQPDRAARPLPARHRPRVRRPIRRVDRPGVVKRGRQHSRSMDSRGEHLDPRVSLDNQSPPGPGAVQNLCREPSGARTRNVRRRSGDGVGI